MQREPESEFYFIRTGTKLAIEAEVVAVKGNPVAPEELVVEMEGVDGLITLKGNSTYQKIQPWEEQGWIVYCP